MRAFAATSHNFGHFGCNLLFHLFGNGFSVYQSIQTQRTDHTQQGVSQTAGRAGYIGPGLMLENGVPADLPPTEDTQPAEKRLASLSVPVLPYALAEDDMPDEPVEPAVAS